SGLKLSALPVLHDRRTQVVVVTLLIMLGFHSAAASAQTYPAKPIRFILPYPPDGGNDFVARVITMRPAQNMHQPVVLDNRSRERRACSVPRYRTGINRAAGRRSADDVLNSAAGIAAIARRQAARSRGNRRQALAGRPRHAYDCGIGTAWLRSNRLVGDISA